MAVPGMRPPTRRAAGTPILWAPTGARSAGAWRTSMRARAAGALAALARPARPGAIPGATTPCWASTPAAPRPSCRRGALDALNPIPSVHGLLRRAGLTPGCGHLSCRRGA